MVTIPIDRLIASARIPERAYESDAGYDLFACEKVEIPPHGRARVRTGLRVEMPDGFFGMIVPRSGLAVQHGITVLNAPGIVDTGYHGEIRVVLYNADPNSAFRVQVGNRIAQLLIAPRNDVAWNEIPWSQLSIDGERNDAGFGSTGI
jgi:dUTP diphosphatase